MRDPERIKRICDALYSCWTQNSDFRLGQLISNINSYYNNDGDIFFPEDEQWEEWIGKYSKHNTFEGNAFEELVKYIADTKKFMLDGNRWE